MNKRVIVIGDTILDEYIKIDPVKVSDEAHVITSNISSKEFVLGGATNVARNICTLGGECFYIGLTSNSVDKQLLDEFKYYNINKFIINLNNSVQIKTRVISTRGYQICRYDSQFSKNILTNEQINFIIKKIIDIIDNYDVLVFSKYYDHFLTKSIIDPIMEICNKKNKLIMVDNRDDDYNLFSAADFYKVNFSEFKQMYINADVKNEEKSIIETVIKYGFKFKNLIVTRSNFSTIVFTREKKSYSYVIIPVDNLDVKDVSGAGDTFMAAFALNFDGKIRDCVMKCHEICNIVVRKMGTNVVWTYEIDNYADVKTICKQLKQNGKVIVFTNGVFDILHTGHIKLLEECNKYGDFLIVGLNSDKSVKQLKGENRPINSELDRKKLLESIKYINKVVIFDDLTCNKILKEIKPDIYIKGGDYNMNNLPEKEALNSISGKVIFVDLVEDKSTTKLIYELEKK